MSRGAERIVSCQNGLRDHVRRFQAFRRRLRTTKRGLFLHAHFPCLVRILAPTVSLFTRICLSQTGVQTERTRQANEGVIQVFRQVFRRP